MYKDMPAHRIRKIAYNHQKNRNNKKNYDPDYMKYERKIDSICIDKNPTTYLLGYIDALEEQLHNLKPGMVFLGSKFKNDLQKEGTDSSVNIFFKTTGAVDPTIIQEHIDKYRDGKFTADQLIQALEESIAKSWQDTLNSNKKYLE